MEVDHILTNPRMMNTKTVKALAAEIAAITRTPGFELEGVGAVVLKYVYRGDARRYYRKDPYKKVAFGRLAKAIAEAGGNVTADALATAVRLAADARATAKARGGAARAEATAEFSVTIRTDAHGVTVRVERSPKRPPVLELLAAPRARRTAADRSTR